MFFYLFEWNDSAHRVLSYLYAPEFERPVKTGGQEVGGEVDLSRDVVTVNPRNGPHVSLKGLTDPSLPVIERKNFFRH